MSRLNPALCAARDLSLVISVDVRVPEPEPGLIRIYLRFPLPHCIHAPRNNYLHNRTVVISTRSLVCVNKQPLVSTAALNSIIE
jgi:hypothetical protein